MLRSFVISACIFMPVGFLIGFLSFKLMDDASHARLISSSEIREGGYDFISPLLECEVEGNRLNALGPLQIQMESLVDSEKEDGTVDEIAIYFRDLNNGPWFGVNEGSAFAPASLLKLPVMMAYLKLYEDNPAGLSKKIKYEEDLVLLDQIISPGESIQKGSEYTVEELIERMMIYSDNAALALLEKNIDLKLVDQVTIDLGIETAGEHTPEDFMSVKGYAGLFRILYNASYLEKDMSEKALEILSRTKFNAGIVAGIPRGVKVSHKFGEREIGDNVKQLHDCGIVYHPKSPYLICIMTRGSDMNRLSQAIGRISEKTYSSIDSYLKTK